MLVIHKPTKSEIDKVLKNMDKTVGKQIFRMIDTLDDVSKELEKLDRVATRWFPTKLIEGKNRWGKGRYEWCRNNMNDERSRCSCRVGDIKQCLSSFVLNFPKNKARTHGKRLKDTRDYLAEVKSRLGVVKSRLEDISEITKSCEKIRETWACNDLSKDVDKILKRLTKMGNTLEKIYLDVAVSTRKK